MAAKKKAKEVKTTPFMKRTFAIAKAIGAYDDAWKDVAVFEKELKRLGYKIVVA